MEVAARHKEIASLANHGHLLSSSSAERQLEGLWSLTQRGVGDTEA